MTALMSKNMHITSGAYEVLSKYMVEIAKNIGMHKKFTKTYIKYKIQKST